MLIAVNVPGPFDVKTNRRRESIATPSLKEPIARFARFRPLEASTTRRLLAQPLKRRFDGGSYARPCGALQFSNGQFASTLPLAMLTLASVAVSAIFT